MLPEFPTLFPILLVLLAIPFFLFDNVDNPMSQSNQSQPSIENSVADFADADSKADTVAAFALIAIAVICLVYLVAGA